MLVLRILLSVVHTTPTGAARPPQAVVAAAIPIAMALATTTLPTSAAMGCVSCRTCVRLRHPRLPILRTAVHLMAVAVFRHRTTTPETMLVTRTTPATQTICATTNVSSNGAASMYCREGLLTVISSSHAIPLLATGNNRRLPRRCRRHVRLLHDDHAHRPHERPSWNGVLLRSRWNLCSGIFRFV